MREKMALGLKFQKVPQTAFDQIKPVIIPNVISGKPTKRHISFISSRTSSDGSLLYMPPKWYPFTCLSWIRYMIPAAHASENMGFPKKANPTCRGNQTHAREQRTKI